MTGKGLLVISWTFWSISWKSLNITKICFLRRLDRIFCPVCIATACKKSDSSSHCRSKLIDFWSHPQMKKCWETKPLDECFLFYGFSCGFHVPSSLDPAAYDSLGSWAGNHTLRGFHHQEFVSKKVCVLWSSQKEQIVSPAIVLRSSTD